MNAMIDTAFRVLVVEDETHYRELLVREIRNMGYPARGAASAEDAWRLLRAEPFAAVLLDLNLPGTTGLDMLALIREHNRDAGVVVLAAFGRLESAVQALRLHPDDFLAKPCTLGEIERALVGLQRRHAEQYRIRQIEAMVCGDEPRRQMQSRPAQQDAQESATLRDLQRVHILKTLAQHRGNKSAAAAQLGISLRTLYNRLKRYERESSN